MLDAFDEIESGGTDDPSRQQQAERGQRRPGAVKQWQRNGDDDGRDDRPAHGTGDLGERGFLPASEGGDAHQKQDRRHERREDGVEIRWPDRNFANAERIDEQRVERAEQNRGSGDNQQYVVGEQQGFAGNQIEAPAEADLGRPPGEQRQRTADDRDQEDQDEDTSCRVGGKGVHRGQHAGADQEGAEQRQ